jgi:hypothetical protein
LSHSWLCARDTSRPEWQRTCCAWCVKALAEDPVVILAALFLYLCVGTAFGVAFTLRGAGVVDPVARASAWHVRLLWLPGAAALWPVFLVKWLRAWRGAI